MTVVWMVWNERFLLLCGPIHYIQRYGKLLQNPPVLDTAWSRYVDRCSVDSDSLRLTPPHWQSYLSIPLVSVIYVCGTGKFLHFTPGPQKTEMPNETEESGFEVEDPRGMLRIWSSHLRPHQIEENKSKQKIKGSKWSTGRKPCALVLKTHKRYWNARVLSVVFYFNPLFESYLYVYSWLGSIFIFPTGPCGACHP